MNHRVGKERHKKDKKSVENVLQMQWHPDKQNDMRHEDTKARHNVTVENPREALPLHGKWDLWRGCLASDRVGCCSSFTRAAAGRVGKTSWPLHLHLCR